MVARKRNIAINIVSSVLIILSIAHNANSSTVSNKHQKTALCLTICNAAGVTAKPVGSDWEVLYIRSEWALTRDLKKMYESLAELAGFGYVHVETMEEKWGKKIK